MTDSNCRHKEYESFVLPTELIYNKDIWQLEWDLNPYTLLKGQQFSKLWSLALLDLSN